MSLEKLKKKYEMAFKSEDLSLQLDFLDELLENNEDEIILFHYNLLKNKSDKRFFQYLRADFKKRGQKGESFLLDKIKEETDLELKGEILHILGGMRCASAKPFAKDLLNETDYNSKYKGIIVLGWLGSKEEIPILNRELLKNEIPELRAFAASALRQIWFNHSKLNTNIIRCYYEALQIEQENIVLSTILASTQEVLKKKFGIKESRYGEISGDVDLAKPKALKAIEKFLKI
ncbi:MAG: HEAT repeat domain-containing protein [Flavobacteriaceae bacterium]|nr:HEAT repeat domain-containing protein [Flavobacteriaceae bacterium]